MKLRLPAWLTGRHAPDDKVMPLTLEGAVEFARTHPCVLCGLPIYVGIQGFQVNRDTLDNVTARHNDCPRFHDIYGERVDR